MKRLLLTLALCLLAAPAWAAITYDTANSGEGTTSATTGSLTVAADANIALICSATRESAGSAVQSASATFGGQAATHLVGVTGSDSVIRVDLFYRLAPPTGSQTAVCTGGAGTDFTVCGAMTFKGVAQTSTFNTTDTAVAATTTNMDVNATASAVGEMVALCGTMRDDGEAATASADAGTPVSTERYEDSHASGNALDGVGYTEDGAVTSIDMRVDLSAATNWAAVAVSMRPLVSTRRASAPIFFQ